MEIPLLIIGFIGGYCAAKGIDWWENCDSTGFNRVRGNWPPPPASSKPEPPPAPPKYE